MGEFEVGRETLPVEGNTTVLSKVDSDSHRHAVDHTGCGVGMGAKRAPLRDSLLRKGSKSVFWEVSI